MAVVNGVTGEVELQGKKCAGRGTSPVTHLTSAMSPSHGLLRSSFGSLARFEERQHFAVVRAAQIGKALLNESHHFRPVEPILLDGLRDEGEA